MIIHSNSVLLSLQPCHGRVYYPLSCHNNLLLCRPIRDLKSDNILVEDTAGQCPHLVVTDFGCCLDGNQEPGGLCVPYTTEQTSKGGNCSLMAPEVSVDAYISRREYIMYRSGNTMCCIWAINKLVVLRLVTPCPDKYLHCISVMV